MNRTIRIGTRKSVLALAQTDYIIEQIKSMDPSLSIEKVLMSTKGDKILDKTLQSFGGKGAFVTEFEEAMLKKEIDLAVHSAKDMPMVLKEGLSILSHSKREDPRDVLVYRHGTDYKEVLENGVVGTCSLRRRLLIEKQYTAKVKELRGNVQTRLAKLDSGEYDGIILAAAGLSRLHLLESKDYQYYYFSAEEFIPAGGQGIIAVEGRSDDDIMVLLEKIDNKTSRYCLEVEREVLRQLDAGCSEPIGVYSNIYSEDKIKLSIIYKHEEHIYEQSGKDSLENRMELASRLTQLIKDEMKKN